MTSKQIPPAIAVVGMSSLFAQAQSPMNFWYNIFSGRDFIDDVPKSHWKIEDYYNPEPGTCDKVYAYRGSFLDDITFDPIEFGIPPSTIPSTDTVQLLALIAAKKVLDDIDKAAFAKLDRKRISVFLGVAAGTELMVSMSARIQRPIWKKALRKCGHSIEEVEEICAKIAQEYTPWVETTFPGLLSNVVAGRIAHRLDLGGTNCVTDAACASSLAAVKMAVDDLRLGHSDMVITGGADALSDIFMYMCFSQTPALSPSGDCRPFSNKADGTILGEGIGMVALRRMDEALRDGDKILAVIHAVGSSSDGQANSVYAPRPQGQALAIQRAYERSPYTIDEVGLIEGHGTGTVAGDKAEFQGLQLAFANSKREDRQFCALGSVKSQIGHTKSAAGIASLSKVIMALQQKVLPPTIKVEKPNSDFAIEESPFYLNTTSRPWIHPQNSTRKASVSSFGFGGTNFHITVEEFTGATPSSKRFPNTTVGSLCLFGAKDAAEMKSKLHDVEQQIGKSSLAFLSRQQQLNFTTDSEVKCGFFARDAKEAKKKLARLTTLLATPSGTIIEDELYSSFTNNRPKIAFLFPGQGSQYLNMGADLAMEFEKVRQVWDEIAAIDFAGTRLHQVVFPIPVFSQQDLQKQREKLVRTEWAQPALGAMSLSLLSLLKHLGISPDCVAGHSYGEITALYSARVIPSLADTMAISRKRGMLMAECAEKKPGTMTAVFSDAESLQERFKRWNLATTIANINSPKQVVISGEVMTIEKIEKKLNEEGIRYQRIPVATAFHSEIVRDSIAPLRQFIENIELSSPECPVYANATGKLYPSEIKEIRDTIAEQLGNPVLFSRQLQTIYDSGVRLFLEVGANQVLTRLVEDCLPDVHAIALDKKNTNGLISFWDALGKLAVLGVPVDFAKLWGDFVELEDELAVSSPSKAAVSINGANYQKPYPNKEEAPLATTDAEIRGKNPQHSHSSKDPHRQSGKDSHPRQREKDIPMKKSSKRHRDDSQWLQAFQTLQHNLITAQKLFQETLLHSHTQFLQVTDSAIHQLNSSNLAETTPRLPSDANLAKASLQPKQLQTSVEFDSEELVHEYLPAPTAKTHSEEFVEQELATPMENAKTTYLAQTPSVVAEATSQIDLGSFQQILLETIAEKTGYPEEMLDLDMKFDSELGIDSIKRVDILSALQEKIPGFSEESSEMTQLNSINEILDYVGEKTAKKKM